MKEEKKQEIGKMNQGSSPNENDMLMQGEGHLSKILDELLNDPEVNFREVLSHIKTLKEVHLLMAKLNEMPLSVRIIRYVESLKRRYDYLYKEIIKDLNQKIQKAESRGDNELRRKLIVEKENQERLADRFSTLYTHFQEKAKEYLVKLEANTNEKKKLLERLRSIVENEEVTRLKDVKEIQRLWRQIGPVHPRERRSLEETFRALKERFFQLREFYKNLVLTDREENYKKKAQLLEDFKSLLEELKEKGLTSDDIKDINARIQNIFDLWESIGPVPREKEAIEVEYRALKKEYLHNKEERTAQFKRKLKENLKKQEQLLAELQKVLTELEPNNTKSWKDVIKKVNQIRKLRRQYLPIPRAEEMRIRKAFGTLLAEFDQKATQHFEQLREAYQRNFEIKERLIQTLGEILQKPDSELVHYQRWVRSMNHRWSRYYYTPKGEKSDNLKAQWNALVDEFYQRLKGYYEEQEKYYPENLEKKKKLLQELQQLLEEMEQAEKSGALDRNAILEKLQAKREEWNSINEVPIEERSRLQDSYYRLLKRLFSKIYQDDRERADLEYYRAKIHYWLQKPYALSRLEKEKAQLREVLKELKEEIQAKQKTLSFIIPSKDSDSFQAQIEKAIERLQGRLKLVKNRLKFVDQTIRELRQKEREMHQALLNTSKASQQAENVEETPES